MKKEMEVSFGGTTKIIEYEISEEEEKYLELRSQMNAKIVSERIDQDKRMIDLSDFKVLHRAGGVHMECVYIEKEFDTIAEAEEMDDILTDLARVQSRSTFAFDSYRLYGFVPLIRVKAENFSCYDEDTSELLCEKAEVIEQFVAVIEKGIYSDTPEQKPTDNCILKLLLKFGYPCDKFEEYLSKHKETETVTFVY